MTSVSTKFLLQGQYSLCFLLSPRFGAAAWGGGRRKDKDENLLPCCRNHFIHHLPHTDYGSTLTSDRSRWLVSAAKMEK